MHPAEDMIRSQVHTLLKVASGPQRAGTAGKKASSEEAGELDKWGYFFSFQIQLSVGRPKERAGKALQQVRLFRETKEAFVRAERAERRASP